MSQQQPHPSWQQPSAPQSGQQENQSGPSPRTSVVTTVIVTVALTVSVLALAYIVWALVLRGNDDQVEVTETPIPQSSVSQSEQTGGAVEEPESEPTQEPADRTDDVGQEGCTPPVAGAYPCAGGPIPEDARPLAAFYLEDNGSWATLQSPSENILCDVIGKDWYAGGYLICTVHSWPYTINPGYEQEGGFPAVFLDDEGPAEISGKGDPMLSQLVEESEGDILPYGTVWYFEDFVFASEDNGITFWNVKSGYGALINRAGMEPFGPR